MLQGSLEKMEGVSALKGLNTFNSKNNMIIGTIVSTYNFVISTAAIPMRLIFRKDMGERAFSPFALMASVSFYFFWGWYGTTFNSMLFAKVHYTPREYFIDSAILYVTATPLPWFLVLVIYLGIRHFKKVIKKAQKNDIGYSFYRGTSRLFTVIRLSDKFLGFRADDTFIRMVIEPLISLLVGLVIFTIPILVMIYSHIPSSETALLTQLFYFTFTGLVIAFSSFCLFLEEFGILMRIRASLLDLVDAEKDIKFLNEKKAKIDNKRANLNNMSEANLDGFSEVIYEHEVLSDKNSKQFGYTELKSKFLNQF